MANIHLHRSHQLGLSAARKVAFAWAEQVEQEFEMACTYEEGRAGDLVSFSRSGVKGTLAVSRDSFELNAQLGLLLGAFKGKIEGEITRRLDELLEAAPPAAPARAAKPAARKKA